MTENYWSRHVFTYEQKQEYVVGGALLETMQTELRQLSNLGRVVEFGCGTCFFTKTIAPLCSELIATDWSDSLLNAACSENGIPGVTFQKEDCKHSSFEDASFNSVFMANVLHVIDDPKAVIAESFRILEPGGRLVITSFTANGMRFWQKIKLVIRFVKTWGKPPAHTHSFSPKHMKDLLENKGFDIEICKLVGRTNKAVFVVARKLSVEKAALHYHKGDRK